MYIKSHMIKVKIGPQLLAREGKISIRFGQTCDLLSVFLLLKSAVGPSDVINVPKELIKIYSEPVNLYMPQKMKKLYKKG